MDVSMAGMLGRAAPDALHAADERGVYLETITALARAVEARDRYPGAHVRRVGRYSRKIGQALGLAEESLWTLTVGAVLHDVGKIGVPDAILGREGPLTEEERAVLRRHPEIGHALLRGVGALAPALEAVLHHHERWDGAGYPAGLAGPTIPLSARIVAVADAFDAMTTPRPHRPPLGLRAAVREIARQAGSQFDPEVVGAFLGTLPGGLVDAALPRRSGLRVPAAGSGVPPQAGRPAGDGEPRHAALGRALHAALGALPERAATPRPRSASRSAERGDGPPG